MSIQLFDEAKVSAYEEDIRALLRICMENNFSEEVPQTFYDEKVENLKHYLCQGKGYFFAAQEGERVKGILWSCEMNTVTARKFHVLYFAVYPEEQGTGISAALLKAAEEKACELGISKMDLMVSADNARAVHFYEKFSYKSVRFAMEKDIPSCT